MNSAIVLQGLTKRYGEKTAVDGLCLSIEQGELFGLLGVNGAGKTTTIRMLSCLARPTGGDALLCGHSIVKAPQKAKEIIGISPQQTAVAPNLTVTENLALVAGLYGMGKAETAARVEALIEEFSLGEFAKKSARTLSGGWQRRLSIAMALVHHPSVLFLDEPTLGLDVLARRALWQSIEALRGKATIVLTTHYLEEAQALCDRIGIMAAGRLCALGTSRDICEKAGCDRFEDAFVALAQEGAST